MYRVTSVIFYTRGKAERQILAPPPGPVPGTLHRWLALLPDLEILSLVARFPSVGRGRVSHLHRVGMCILKSHSALDVYK